LKEYKALLALKDKERDDIEEEIARRQNATMETLNKIEQ